MKQTEEYIINGGIKIHTISTANVQDIDTSRKKVRIIIVPGATASAESIYSDIQAYITLPTTVMSVRGRGQSDVPDSGYSLDEQASDVVAVCQHFSSDVVLLVGHSLGVPMIIRAIAQLAEPSNVAGLVLCDFPPFYPPLDKSWADMVLRKPTTTISKKAIFGLVKDSSYTDVFKDLLAWEGFIGVIIPEEDRGIRPEDEEILRRNMPEATFTIIEGAKHELFSTKAQETMQILREFAVHL